jgi:hypothetical protein
MKILSTSADAQTFKIIPREYVTTATLIIRDDSTNTENTYSNISTSISVNHLEIQQAFSPVLVEGRFYDMILKNTQDKIIYKDKIFCTDQAIDQAQEQEYTVNSGEYITDTSHDNDFIII